MSRLRTINWFLVAFCLGIFLYAPAATYAAPSGYRLPFVGKYNIIVAPGCYGTHQGVSYEAMDFTMGIGTRVYATQGGDIIFASDKDTQGYGNLMKIKHDDGNVSYYAHLNKFIKQSGRVTRGEYIGESGNTGKVTGPHLHFEIRDSSNKSVSYRDMPGITLYKTDKEPPCSDGQFDGEAVGPPLENSTTTFGCDGSEGVFLYEHIDYSGRCSKFTSDSPSPQGWNIGNDNASSIRIIGSWIVTLYEHDSYQGRSNTFSASDPDLRDNPIGNDQASSIRVQRGSGTSESSLTPDTTKSYRIISVNSGKGLDVAGAGQANGTLIQQWDYAGGQNQKWRFEAVGDGYYTIRAMHSNRCLDVSGVSRDNGAVLHQWDCVGGDNQKWRLLSVDGAVVLQAKHSGKVVDVAGGSRDNGARVHQWDRHNGPNQRWRIEAVQ